MLDLGKLNQELYSIRLADKTILKLKKPTQAMILTMIEFRENGDLEEIEVLNSFYSFMTRMFNRNVNNKEFKQDDIEEMLDIETAMIVFKDYMEFSFNQMGE